MVAIARGAAQVVPMKGDPGTEEGYSSVYRRWVYSQGVPITDGIAVPDLYALETKPWADTGVNMNFAVLDTTGDLTDFWVMDIPPGGQLKPFRHMFHAIYHVLTGRGATSVWINENKKHTFEWQRGSLFCIPLNANYEMFNGSGSEPARLVACTTAPLSMRLHPYNDFIFGSDAVFPTLFTGDEDDYFSGENQAKNKRAGAWQSNFVADVRNMEVFTVANRGQGSIRTFSVKGSFLEAHTTDWDPGTYRKPHRHGPGAHVLLLTGVGYSLNWADGKDKYKVYWKDGTVYCPPNYFWHQHFNPGPEQARFLAFKMGGGHLVGRTSFPYAHSRYWPSDVPNNLANQGDQIDYDEEDPWVKDDFVEECKKWGGVPKLERMTMDYEKKLAGGSDDM